MSNLARRIEEDLAESDAKAALIEAENATRAERAGIAHLILGYVAAGASIASLIPGGQAAAPIAIFATALDTFLAAPLTKSSVLAAALEIGNAAIVAGAPEKDVALGEKVAAAVVAAVKS